MANKTEHNADQNTAEASVRAGVMAAFLQVGTAIDHASSALLIATILLALLVQAQTQMPALAAGGYAHLLVPVVAVAMLLAIIAKYFAWRVALDASLFRVLERHQNEISEFDATLHTCISPSIDRSMGRMNRNTGRTLDDRWRGAKKLLLLQLLLVATQTIAALAVLAIGLM